MGFFNDIKTRTKLLLSFSILILITIVVGVNGMLTARDIQKDLEKFYTERFLSNMQLLRSSSTRKKQLQRCSGLFIKPKLQRIPLL